MTRVGKTIVLFWSAVFVDRIVSTGSKITKGLDRARQNWRRGALLHIVEIKLSRDRSARVKWLGFLVFLYTFSLTNLEQTFSEISRFRNKPNPSRIMLYFATYKYNKSYISWKLWEMMASVWRSTIIFHNFFASGKVGQLGKHEDKSILSRN